MIVWISMIITLVKMDWIVLLTKKMLECNRIHSSWRGIKSGDMEEIVEDEENDEEDVDVNDLAYTDGSNEVVKIFNQKHVFMP